MKIKQFEESIKWFPKSSTISETIYEYTNAEVPISDFLFNYVSGPLKLKLLRALCPFSVGRQTP